MKINLITYAVTERLTKSGAVQYSQKNQVDQIGEPPHVFTRTSMKPGFLPAAGNCTADISFYTKRVKNDDNDYMNDITVVAFRNITAA